MKYDVRFNKHSINATPFLLSYTLRADLSTSY